MKARLLLVEDNLDMRRTARILLDRAGYLVTEAGSAEEALAAIERSLPDLVVSDIQLPGISGIKLCSILREQPRTAALPILLLTVLSRAPEKVQGLETGADDYLTKPYDPREFLARIQALLRRVQRASSPVDVLERGGVRIDLAGREVTADGRPISLRKKEYELLVYLIRHGGKILSRERINRALWGDEVIVGENALTVHIRELRKALGPRGEQIKTLVGEGYRFDDLD